MIISDKKISLTLSRNYQQKNGNIVKGDNKKSQSPWQSDKVFGSQRRERRLQTSPVTYQPIFEHRYNNQICVW